RQTTPMSSFFFADGGAVMRTVRVESASWEDTNLRARHGVATLTSTPDNSMLLRHSIRLAIAVLAVGVLDLVAAPAAAAQGGNVDIISGTITDQAGKPIVNA